MQTASNEEIGWYALRVFHNKTSQVCAIADKEQVEWYTPLREIEEVVAGRVVLREERVMPSLLFVRSTPEFIAKLKVATADNILTYNEPGTNKPMVIDDEEMSKFMFVVRTSAKEVESIDIDRLNLHDRVRISGGIFAGMEGYIARVHGTKRFVVRIEGIAAIATTYIPKQYIQKLTTL
jgi:transcription antitermination factor NusG